ncbi:MAG: protoporphyrinogen oxidase [Gemmatimonadales bacterium]|nr:protoporphyrinogen oxidase [Gemmatimonadales bacterium]
MSERNPTSVAVIGGGIAGLATSLNLLDEANRRDHPIQVTTFEKDNEPGGNLRTLRLDEWQLEWGPNGFLDNEPATLRLVKRLDLNDQLQRSSDATRRRFLLVGGRLREIPTSPWAFLKSDLLPTGAKLRMAGELFIPQRKNLGRAAEDATHDETIAQFGNRRLGRAFTRIMLDPMVKGIFGGEAHKLSLAAAFPRMVELEKEYGGLFKAMFALGREKKKRREKKKQGKGRTDAGPTGTLHSFDGGMAALIDAIEAALAIDDRAELITGSDVQRIRPHAVGWFISDKEREHGPFDAVIEATPAHAAVQHLGHLSPDLQLKLAAIPFAPMAVIALGFDRTAITHDLDGFGLLVPGCEKRELLGSLWTSSIFQGRTPTGKVLLRCMAGGSGNPGVMDLDDEGLVTLVLAELRSLLGIKGSPEMARVIRHQRAIAQYLPGHLARLRSLERSISDFPGLFLTGSSYRGISVNSCVKEAEATAGNVLDHLVGKTGRAAPPPTEAV